MIAFAGRFRLRLAKRDTRRHLRRERGHRVKRPRASGAPLAWLTEEYKRLLRARARHIPRL